MGINTAKSSPSKDFNWDDFESLEPKTIAGKSAAQPKKANDGDFNWDDFEALPGYEPPKEPEPLWKRAFRKVYQPLAGIAQLYTAPLDMLHELPGAIGEDTLREMGEYNPESAAAAQKINEKYQSFIPTQGKIEKFLEEKAGLPLEARSDWDKALRLSGSAFKLRDGTLVQKALASVLAPTAEVAMEKGPPVVGLPGVPKWLAEPSSLLLSQLSPMPFTKGIKTKASGLPVRRYENLKKTTYVTPRQAANIRVEVENDVRTAVDELVSKKSPTAVSMKKDPGFRQKIDETFDRVADLATKLPENPSQTKTSVAQALRRQAKKRPTTGITTDATERAYKNEITRLTKELSKPTGLFTKKRVSDALLLEQYRKNNKALGAYYEPGKSLAENLGKRDALLDYNRTIADIWEKRYPKSQFNKLFKYSNEQYSKIADIDTINGFMDDVFHEGKINYNTAKKLFKDPLKDSHLRRSFERILGKETAKELDAIFSDFVSTESAMKLVKASEAAGFKNMATHAGRWVISPTWGKLAALKGMTQYVRNEFLSSPEAIRVWKSGIEAFKKGRYSEAIYAFNTLDKIENEIKKQGVDRDWASVGSFFRYKSRKEEPTTLRQSNKKPLTPHTPRIAVD